MKATRRAVMLGAAALAARLPAEPRRGPALRSGLDRVLAEQRGRITGKRIALLSHDAALAADGRRGVDALTALPGVTLATLFAPEHGFAGAAAAGEHIGDGRDSATGLPVFSLYGARRAPEPGQLAGHDLLVIDLQDVGLRCYTYAGTALAAIEAAASAKVPVLVLDRPNPLGGLAVEGPLPDPAFVSPVTALAVPFRHGQTLGELIRGLTPGEFGGKIDLVAMDDWRRGMGTAAFGPGGLPFAPPSPNLRSPAAILAYGASVLLEGTNLSEGRGSEAPFELVGAPWVDASALARAMARARLPGVRFAPARFTPESSKHAGQECAGLRIAVTDEARFNALETGLELVIQLRLLHPGTFSFLRGKQPYFDLLSGRAAFREGIERGLNRAAILAPFAAETSRYRSEAAATRIY